jgi:hypothetical protein
MLLIKPSGLEPLRRAIIVLLGLFFAAGCHMPLDSFFVLVGLCNAIEPIEELA